MEYSVLHRGQNMDKGRVTGKSVWVGKVRAEKTRAGVPYLTIGYISHYTSLNLSFPICIIGIIMILLRVLLGFNEIKKLKVLDSIDVYQLFCIFFFFHFI